jgi:hypothetical protein
MQQVPPETSGNINGNDKGKGDTSLISKAHACTTKLLKCTTSYASLVAY